MQQIRRVRLRITGAVQGVGFRPHVFRLAGDHGLSGWVLNSIQGVVIEAEGPLESVASFVDELRAEPPPNAVVRTFLTEDIAPQGSEGFAVRQSDPAGEPSAFLLPDLAACPACLTEVFDPSSRRHLYPFTTCTHCGPRYSIVESIPYDRPLTSMRHFPMCPACEREYRDAADRRFHAQTNACAACGPRLELWDRDGRALARDHDALLQAAAAVREGRILALKGLGGFHLVCDAANREAIDLLRRRKRRPAKPFAILAASLDGARTLCKIDQPAAALLTSPQAPIVLLARAAGCTLPEELAPGNPTLGLMLPYTPLHALLMADLRGPVIATSGNLTDDPICFDEREAVRRLHAVADVFLVHNRPILRPVDDSVVRFIDGQAVLLRRARGYAPLPIDAGRPLREVFSTGAHMKNTVAFSRGSLVFLSQHLGDLESEAGAASHRLAAEDFERVYQVRPALVAHDAHPGYGSTSSALAMAGRLGVPTVPVQHHEAHVWAAMAEHHLHGPLVGVSWDGSGWGPDGTVWGGEFLVFEDGRFRRAAHLRTFALPGGEQAVREPRRSLLGVLDAIGRAAEAEPLFAQAEWRVLRAAMARGLNSPRTTSAGRLFDAAAALAGLTPRASFEGQAAMELEYLAESGSTEEMVALTLDGGVLDWAPLVETLLERRLPQRESARLFHNSIAGGIVTAALQVGIEDVVLTGGCFQNALLTGLAARALRSRGFRVHTHRLVPPNDGALALGQVLAAAAKGD